MYLRNKDNYSYLVHPYRENGKIRHYQKYLGNIPRMSWDKYQKTRKLIYSFSKKYDDSDASRELCRIFFDARYFGVKLGSPPKIRFVKHTFHEETYWSPSSEMYMWVEDARRKIQNAKDNYFKKNSEVYEQEWIKNSWNNIRNKCRKYNYPFKDFKSFFREYSKEKKKSAHVLDDAYYQWLWDNGYGGLGEAFKALHVNVNGAYKVLELSEGASESEVKASYRRLAKKYHPDMPNGDLEKFKAIDRAYKLIAEGRR